MIIGASMVGVELSSSNTCQRYEPFPDLSLLRLQFPSQYMPSIRQTNISFFSLITRLIMLTFFKYVQAETLKNKSWFAATEVAHGHNGPLVTAPHDPAPISSLVLESYQSMGLPLIPDMFSTGESAHGCGHVVRTIYQGTRTSAADYITKSNAKDNIFIQTKTYVDRINLEKDDTAGLRANGVHLQGADGQKTFLKARKEVIVTAGTYSSPAILLRSGIGAKHEVEKLGLKSQVDLPGVGKNLMDHLVSLMSPCSTT